MANFVYSNWSGVETVPAINEWRDTDYTYILSNNHLAITKPMDQN